MRINTEHTSRGCGYDWKRKVKVKQQAKCTHRRNTEWKIYIDYVGI